MPPTEKSTPTEPFREVRLNIPELRGSEVPSLRSRLAPYGFGALLIAAVVAALAFLYSNPAEYVTEDSELPGEVERLVAGAKERMNRAGDYPLVSEGDAVLTISTNPAGALVDIDYKNAGLTPLEYPLRPGVYMISIRLADYVGVDTVLVVEPDEPQELSFLLTRLDSGGRGDAAVNDPASRSGGAVDGVNARSQEAGRPNPSSAAAGASNPSVGSAVRKFPDAASAELVVSSHPAGADVLLDGRRMGKTPLSLRNVTPGSRRIQLVMEAHETFATEINARAGETKTVHGELTRESGTISVLVRPWGSIYIDGVLHIQSTDVKYVTRLPAGEYTVRAVHPDLGAAERTVRIEANAIREIVLDLP